MTNLKLLSRDIFLQAPPATCIWGSSFYASLNSLELIGEGQHLQRSDTVECMTVQRSQDNGRSWSEMEVTQSGEKSEGGVARQFIFPGYLCPHTGRMVRFTNQAVLPNDSPSEAGKFWRTYYSVSEDGDRTIAHQGIIQQKGAEFSADHPLPEIWHGKNSYYRGALSGAPLTLDSNSFLVPLQCTVLDANQELYAPGGGYGWFVTLILKGTWQSDGDIDWEQLALVQGDPAQTTRGMIEGTLGHLDNGRLLLVMRGSNDANHDLPGYKWYSTSDDGGHTWTRPVPWTFADGSTLYSASSCSQLIPHSSGALLWVGNTSPDNPKGNWPRQPLVAGIVDPANGLLVQDSLCVIDRKEANDDESLQLSNFYAREDRETGDLIVHCSRLAHASPQGWQADAMLYRVAVND